MKRFLLLLVAILTLGIASANDNPLDKVVLNQIEAWEAVPLDTNVNMYTYGDVLAYGSGYCQQEDAYATTTYFYNTETGQGSRVVVRKSDNKVIDYKPMSASMAQAVCAYLAPA